MVEEGIRETELGDGSRLSDLRGQIFQGLGLLDGSACCI